MSVNGFITVINPFVNWMNFSCINMIEENE